MKREHFRCACCGRVLPKNPRVKNQRYCGAAKCQHARKAEWQREKMATDSDYKANQREANRIWRKKNSEYQKNYRKRNVGYQKRNRLLQIIRDKRNSDHRPHDENLVKMDTLSQLFNDNSATYIISPGPAGLVKMDALEVKITQVTAS